MFEEEDEQNELREEMRNEEFLSYDDKIFPVYERIFCQNAIEDELEQREIWNMDFKREKNY